MINSKDAQSHVCNVDVDKFNNSSDVEIRSNLLSIFSNPNDLIILCTRAQTLTMLKLLCCDFSDLKIKNLFKKNDTDTIKKLDQMRETMKQKIKEENNSFYLLKNIVILEMISYLLDQGCPSNVTDSYGRTLIFGMRNIKFLQAILNKGVIDINVQDQVGFTALGYSLRDVVNNGKEESTFEVLQLLIQHGGKLGNNLDSDGVIEKIFKACHVFSRFQCKTDDSSSFDAEEPNLIKIIAIKMCFVKLYLDFDVGKFKARLLGQQNQYHALKCIANAVERVSQVFDYFVHREDTMLQKNC